MKFLFVMGTLFLAYARSENATSSAVDNQKEAQIRSTARQIILFVDNELQNATLGGEKNSISKRMHLAYPNIMNAYYPKAYGILKAACTGGNPHLYQPAPGGGYYRPISNRFNKRQGRIDHEIDGIAENVKIVQKQLAVAWKEEFLRGHNSLSRRAPSVGSLADDISRTGSRHAQVDPNPADISGESNSQKGLFADYQGDQPSPASPSPKLKSSDQVLAINKPIAWKEVLGWAAAIIVSSSFIGWLVARLLTRNTTPSAERGLDGSFPEERIPVNPEDNYSGDNYPGDKYLGDNYSGDKYLDDKYPHGRFRQDHYRKGHYTNDKYKDVFPIDNNPVSDINYG